MKIKLKQFEGPLDLLLQLIEEQKLNITEISLAQVTEQFLLYMRSLTTLRPQDLASWLVVAAKLLVIKSRSLLPALKLPEEEIEDATNLTWQLYQYKRYKEAAKFLNRLQQGGRQSFTRQVSFIQKVAFYPDPAANPATLRNVMKYLAKTLEAFQAVPKKILEEVVTISEKINELQREITEKVETRLRDLLASARSKTEVIVTFLALLELVKQKILTVEQEASFSDIIIRKR